MSNQGKTAVVFTDGSVKNQGFSNATAGYGVFWGHGHANNRSNVVSGQQDSNRAELFAAYDAIKTAAHQGFSGINVCSDSTYVRNSVMGNSQQTHNRDLVDAIQGLKSKVVVNVQQVTGHSGIPRNDEAHRLAAAAAKR